MLTKGWTKSLMVGMAVSLFLVGCTKNEASKAPVSAEKPANQQAAAIGEPKTGGTITVGLSEEPDQLDVQKTGLAVADIISSNFGMGLVSQDPQTLKFEPSLAESWQVSEDGKTWTFKIRSGVTFHDGTSFTAQSYVDTVKRALDPATNAQVAGSNLAEVQSVSAPDATTLVLQLKEPFAPLLQYLSDPGFMQPLSLEAINKAGNQYGRNPVGVGPWKFESWVTGQSITLARNDAFKWPEPFYQNQGAPRPDKLVYKFISENQTRLAALDSGSIDIATGVTAKDIQKYTNNPDFEVKEMLRNGLGLFLMTNTRKPAMQDIHVRKALNMVINKDDLMKAVIQGEGVPAYGPLPPNYFGYDKAVEDYGYKYDIEAAKSELEQAGWTLNSEGMREKDGKALTFELLSMTGVWDQAAQVIQAMCKEIGIEIKITNLEWGTLVDTATKGNFDLTLMGYTYNDPDVLYLFLHSSQTGGLNFSYIKDQKLDDLLVKGRTTVDSDARKQVYADIQKYVVEQAWWVPLYTEKQFSVVNKRVQGLIVHPLRGLGLQYYDAWVNQ
ncbi:ABC transporter substrate-binding protein [Paenibacillus solisilvae]|uniref:ABC transporter substrate-binding protein n=1 Tax=Paenibacillus solisilvae TaxID=2486751 RepID=A0ABW0VZS4_9BACL